MQGCSPTETLCTHRAPGPAPGQPVNPGQWLTRSALNSHEAGHSAESESTSSTADNWHQNITGYNCHDCHTGRRTAPVQAYLIRPASFQDSWRSQFQLFWGRWNEGTRDPANCGILLVKFQLNLDPPLSHSWKWYCWMDSVPGIILLWLNSLAIIDAWCVYALYHGNIFNECNFWLYISILSWE